MKSIYDYYKTENFYKNLLEKFNPQIDFKLVFKTPKTNKGNVQI